MIGVLMLVLTKTSFVTTNLVTPCVKITRKNTRNFIDFPRFKNNKTSDHLHDIYYNYNTIKQG